MLDPNAPVNPLVQAVSRPQQPPSTPKARALRATAGFGALAVIAALMLAPNFWPYVTRLDHWTADWRTAYLSRQPAAPHPRIVVVGLTDEVLKNVSSSPIDRGVLADVIEAIDRAGATAIGLDILFLKGTEANKDERLVRALREVRAKVVLGALDARGELQLFQREFQSAYLSRADRPVGYLNLRYEADQVVRFAASPAGSGVYPESFARLMAKAGGAADPKDADRPIPWLLSDTDNGLAFLTIPAEKLLGPAGAAEAAKLKDKLVFVGGIFPFRDQHRVPPSVRTGKTVAGVYIHASILAGLLDPGPRLAEASPMAVRLLLAGLALAAIALGLAMWQSNFVTFLGHGFAVALLVAIDALCFSQFRLLLPFTLAVTAWVAGITAGRFLGAVFRPQIALRRTST